MRARKKPSPRDVADRLTSFTNPKKEYPKTYEEFVSLVKRMREAQTELNTCSIGDYAFRQHCAAQLESEVDEYLKKMEERK